MTLVRQLYANVPCEAAFQEPGCPGDQELIAFSRDRLSQNSGRRLVELWLRDRVCVAKTREVCRLDFSPVWDSQDPAGEKVRIGPGESESSVVTELHRPPTSVVIRLRFDLVQHSGSLRIRNIATSGMCSMFELLSQQP